VISEELNNFLFNTSIKMESGSPTRLKSPDWSIPSSSTAQESELHNPVPVISDHLPQQGFNPAHSSPGDESDKSSHETDIAKPMNLGKSGEEQENLRQEEREALEGWVTTPLSVVFVPMDLRK